MLSRRSPMLIAFVIALVSATLSSWAAPALGEEVRGEPPGLLIMEIDGLSGPAMRSALESSVMPFLDGLIESGSHTLGSWQTTEASTTTVTQAGILHGRWQDIPGFRWWDRDLGQLIDSSAAPTSAPTAPAPAYIGEQVCVTAEVTGAVGRLCARRYRFGAEWTLELSDEEADGRDVAATVSLDVSEAPDPTETFVNDAGEGHKLHAEGRFSPRTGTAIGRIAITTCVVLRSAPDRCRTRSTPLPQLASQGTPAQLARLRSLAFDQSIESFMASRGQEQRSGVDLAFDWESDGCSAGPFARLVDDWLEPACLRHDFGYRNFGNLFHDPTDSMRRRVDEQLGRDAAALGLPEIADGLVTMLQQFGGPVFFGTEITAAWSSPTSRVMTSSQGEEEPPWDPGASPAPRG